MSSSSSSDDDVPDAETGIDTEYDTDDEIEPQLGPISITPVKKPNRRQQNSWKLPPFHL